MSAEHYGDDLAALHHAHFGTVARDAAAELLRRLGAAGFTSGRLVDLAAGSGILSRALVDAGYEVLGVDISAAMLDIARRLVPEATFVHGSLWQAALPDGIVAVAAVGEAFSYATDPAAGLAGLRERLTSIHRALVPGGVLLFDVAGPGRSGPSGFRERSFDRDGSFIRLEESEDGASGTLTRELTIFASAGGLYRRSDEVHRLVLFEPETVEALLAEVGFVGERLACYGETEFPPGWCGFVARKRGGESNPPPGVARCALTPG